MKVTEMSWSDVAATASRDAGPIASSRASRSAGSAAGPATSALRPRARRRSETIWARLRRILPDGSTGEIATVVGNRRGGGRDE